MSEPVTFLTNLDEERIVEVVGGNGEWKPLVEYEVTEEMGALWSFSVEPFPHPVEKIGVYLLAKPAAGGDFRDNDGVKISFIYEIDSYGLHGGTAFNVYKLQDNDQMLDKTQLQVWLETEFNVNMPMPIWHGFANGRFDAVRMQQLKADQKSAVGLHLRALTTDGYGWDFGPGTICKVYYK